MGILLKNLDLGNQTAFKTTSKGQTFVAD